MSAGNRRAGLLVTTGAVLAVLIATLTPAASDLPTSGPFCVICGQAGTIDALQNVVLFLPFGFGLAWLGFGRTGTALAAFLLTGFVETLQFTIIPGRDASLGDLLFNTLGGIAGFALQRSRFNPLLPSPRLAPILRGVAALAWLACLLVATFGFRPASPPARADEWQFASPHDSADGAYFSGTVRAVFVNDVQLLLTAPGRLEQVRRLLGQRPSTVTVEVTPGNVTSGYATIYAARSGRSEVFSFGQAATDLLCERYLAASLLLLRTPAFVLPGALPPADHPVAERGESYRVRCAWHAGHMVVRRVSSRGDSIEVRVPLSPGTGWALFLPARLGAPTPLSRSLSFAWLIGIALPVGLWFPYSRAPRGYPESVHAESAARTAPRWSVFGEHAPVVASLFAVLLIQRVLPILADTAPSPPTEYLATAIGFLLGAVAAHLMRQRPGLSIRP